jgi:hypothetical protein
MTRRRRILPLGLAAVFALAGGTAWAVTQADDAASDRPTTPPVPTGKVAEGTAPSGETYTVSRLDPAQFKADPGTWFCREIVTGAASAAGCDPVADQNLEIDGQPLKPSFALLGSDRFFSMIAPDGVTSMEVQVKGGDKTTAAKAADAGSLGTLLVAVVGGREVTSRDPSTSRDYEVRLLGPDGETLHEFAMSDPGRGE